MKDLTGYFYMDGYDLWKTFSVYFSVASSNLLAIAPRKPSQEHDWSDVDGIDMDTSQFFFQARDIPLECGIQVQSETEFWLKYNAFVQLLTKPGQRRISITAHGARAYFVVYKSCSPFRKVKGLKGTVDEHKIFYNFTLTVTQPQPKPDNSVIAIVDDNRQPILT